MANNQIQKFADMVNLQMAAEAFWANYAHGIFGVSGDGTVLGVGNKANSLEPTKIAELFKATGRYTLIAHQDLSLNGTTVSEIGIAGIANKSGFSASIFWDNERKEYTLSVRSTEMATPIKDPGDMEANLNIAQYGWGIAQVNSLEKFWNSILDGTAMNGANAITIPDLAKLTDFKDAIGAGTKINVTGYSLGANIAEAFNELHPNTVSNVYIFNGAGTGFVIPPYTLKGVMARFNAIFDNPEGYIPTQNHIEEFGNTGSYYDALVKYYANPNATYDNIYENPRYRFALDIIASMLEGAALNSHYFDNPNNVTHTRETNFYDLWASNFEGDNLTDTIVAKSGIRHGINTPIFYENQPAATWTQAGADEAWDWGTGHSLTLLQDSLNLMAAFEKLDPNVTTKQLGEYFLQTSNKDYESLDKALDGLGRFFGKTTDVNSATADNQFADIGLRNSFHDKLYEITNSATFKALAGKVSITAPPKSASEARSDLGLFLACIT